MLVGISSVVSTEHGICVLIMNLKFQLFHLNAKPNGVHRNCCISSTGPLTQISGNQISAGLPVSA
jgi:hypothetical protein